MPREKVIQAAKFIAERINGLGHFQNGKRRRRKEKELASIEKRYDGIRRLWLRDYIERLARYRILLFVNELHPCLLPFMTV
jgi:hypothetical protein